MAEALAYNVGEYADVTIKPIAFEGHCYYARKCLPGEEVDGDPTLRKINGVVLPNTFDGYAKSTRQGFGERSHWLEVIGIGFNIGKPCSKAHQKKFSITDVTGKKTKRPRCLDQDIQVGDLVLCPEHGCTGMKKAYELFPHSNSEPYEFFIEESVPFLIYKN